MPLSRLLCRGVLLTGLLLVTTGLFAAPARYESVVFDRIDVKSDVEFCRVTNVRGETERLKLDVYQPAGDTERKRPAIVWFHGGGFRPGNDKKQRYIVAMATAFAQRGYVSVAPDYRVRAEPGPDRKAILVDAVSDGEAALAWVKAHAEEYGIDPALIAVGGGSAGGMLAISLAGLHNATAAKSNSPKLFAFVDLWGTPKADFMLTEVDEHYPPTIIVHGTADRSVSFANSEAFAARLKAVGIRHELMPLADAPHTPMQHLDAFVLRTSAFLFESLKK